MAGFSPLSSARVVHPVVQRFGPPQGVRVVELEEVDSLPRVGVGPGVDLLKVMELAE